MQQYQNTWYTVNLALDDAGGFTARVARPLVVGTRTTWTDQASYRATLPNARGLGWRFRHMTYSGTTFIDSYQEFNGAAMRYDEAASSNGKGQRTSMTSPGVTQSWQYDARGRETSTTQSLSGLSGSRTIKTAYDGADRITHLTYPPTESAPAGERVEYGYDAGWRQSSLCSATFGVCYAYAPNFDALNQPLQWSLHGGLVGRWSYKEKSRRQADIRVGTLEQPEHHLWQSYMYDPAGNVESITDQKLGEIQSFEYDHRDRLTSANAEVVPGGSYTGSMNYATSFAYSPIGNLVRKGGMVYGYPASGKESVHPHAATCTNVVKEAARQALPTPTTPTATCSAAMAAH